MIEIKGYWWPDTVGEQYHYSLNHANDLAFAIDRCTKKRTAVQAGANIGIYPKLLAAHFKKVYTFEPDPVLYECLQKNAPEQNIVRSRTAVGQMQGMATLFPKNLGSGHIVAGIGDVMVVAIDQLELQDCDLIQLDIEGFEFYALQGAVETIKRCKPIIQIEVNETVKRHGLTGTEAPQLIQSLGYKQIGRKGADKIYAYNG